MVVGRSRRFGLYVAASAMVAPTPNDHPGRPYNRMMPLAKPPLTVVMTADCCNGPFAEHASRARWQAIFEQAATLQRMIHWVTRERGHVTWFVRADNQISATLGDAMACFQEWQPLLLAWRQAGEAIGFHPHCYKLLDGVWGASTDDVANAAMLLSVGRRLRELPYPVTVARIGEAHMTDLLSVALRELGIRADCTALPGRVRHDPPRHDWSRCPRTPYQPEVDDYQLAGPPVEGAMWEIPFSMVPIQGPTEEAPRERYLNLGFRPEYLQPALEAWLPDQTRIVTLMHPVETLDVEDEVGAQFPLLAFEAEAVSSNLLFLQEYCARVGRLVEFVTVPELVERLR